MLDFVNRFIKHDDVEAIDKNLKTQSGETVLIELTKSPNKIKLVMTAKLYKRSFTWVERFPGIGQIKELIVDFTQVR